jgi:replicative DNA helicase
MTQKTDWKKKQISRIVESFTELDESQQMEVMDAIKYNYALQAAKQVGMTKTVTFGDMYDIAIERQKYFNKYEGFGSGLPYFDEATMGFREGEVTIIAGPSSVGKTMVAMNLVANIVASTLKKAVMITMEMTPEEVSSRLYNMIDEKEHSILKKNYIIQTELSVSAEHVKAIIKKHKPDILIIDHLGFLAKQESGPDLKTKIDSAIAKVKRMAINEKIPIILISHVAKTRSGVDGEANAQDLMGSAGIEQDSDIVFMINRTKSQMNPLGKEIMVVLEKHRTKDPDIKYEKAILVMKGVRTDGTYSLYNPQH